MWKLWRDQTIASIMLVGITVLLMGVGYFLGAWLEHLR